MSGQLQAPTTFSETTDRDLGRGMHACTLCSAHIRPRIRHHDPSLPEAAPVPLLPRATERGWWVLAARPARHTAPAFPPKPLILQVLTPPVPSAISPVADDDATLLRASERSLAITAIALEQRVRLRELSRLAGPSLSQEANHLTTQLSDGLIVHVYAIGAAVVEGVSELSRERITELQQALGDSLSLASEESLLVTLDPSPGADRIRVEWDRVVLPQLDRAAIDVVCYLMAQSVALERYERGADGMVGESLALAREFAVQGRPPWRRGLPIRRVARLAEQRLELARWFFPLDRPDWTWEDERIATLYDALFDNLELHDRHEVLLHKLASVESTLRIVIELWEGRRSRSLEWAIVLLIVFEIVLAALSAAFP